MSSHQGQRSFEFVNGNGDLDVGATRVRKRALRVKDRLQRTDHVRDTAAQIVGDHIGRLNR